MDNGVNWSCNVKNNSKVIARISAGSFIKGAVMYNENKVEDGEAKVLELCNFDDDTIDSKTAIFRMSQRCKKSDHSNEMRIKKPVFSCSLNLNQSDLDRLKTLKEEKGEEAENDFYREMAHRYMTGMGYGKQPYIVYKHEDIERTHIHIVSVRVDENRRKINDSNEKRRSERVRQEINKQMGLSTEGERNSAEINTRADKRNRYITQKREELESLTPNAGAPLNDHRIRHKISNILKFVDEHYNPKNMAEYNRILSQFNIRCHKIDAVNKEGVRIGGCQFGVVDAHGSIASHLVKGGAIGERFTLPKLEQRFALASALSKDIRSEDLFSKKYIEEQIKSVLAAPRSIDWNYFRDTLRVRGIETDFVENEETGEVVGLNYIDNLNGKVFSGTAIGRNYTYGMISKSIEKHNSGMDGGFLEKEAFLAANRCLVTLYSETRKQSGCLESEILRALPSYKQKFTEVLIRDLHLTQVQADTCFESYSKFKRAQLPSVEAKENRQEQKMMVAAVQFASRMVADDQARVNFLYRMGFEVSGAKGGIVFHSFRKEDVSLSLEEVMRLTAESPIAVDESVLNRVMPPKSDLEPFTRVEVRFVENYASGGEISSLRGDFAAMAELLNEEERKKVADVIALQSQTIYKRFLEVVRPVRNKTFKASGQFESAYIRNMDDHKEKMIGEAMSKMGMGESVANALYERYKSYQTEQLLPKVLEKERGAISNRLRMAICFAEKIEPGLKRTEFLKKMEFSIVSDANGTKFECDRMAGYYPSLEGMTITPGAYPPTGTLKSLPKPFSKKERDFVRDYLDGKSVAGSRYAAALSYLGQEEQNRVRAVGIAYRLTTLLADSETKGVDELVRALTYRGYVIHESSENGQKVYKVGRYNTKSQDAMATLPASLAERLSRSNFSEAYRAIRNQVMGDGLSASPKLRVVMKLARAADFDDKATLRSAIDDVRAINPLLAKKMEEASLPQANGSVDYDRVTRLVAGYRGERRILLPPPSADRGRTDKLSVHDMVRELQTSNALVVAVRLLKDGKECFDKNFDKSINNKL